MLHYSCGWPNSVDLSIGMGANALLLDIVMVVRNILVSENVGCSFIPVLC